MSSKSSKPPKISAPPKPPRQLTEITNETRNIVAQVGWAQYEVEVKKAQIGQMNQHIFNLNQEAEARKKLDAEAPALTPEVVNVQS